MTAVKNGPMREQEEGGRKFIGEEDVGTMEWAEFGWTNERAGCWGDVVCVCVIVCVWEM